MLSTTEDRHPGKLHWTRTTKPYTSRQLSDSRRFTKTNNTTCTTRQTDGQASTPNREKRISSNFAPSPGRSRITDGLHNEVGMRAPHVARACIRASQHNSLKNDWQKHAPNSKRTKHVPHQVRRPLSQPRSSPEYRSSAISSRLKSTRHQTPTSTTLRRPRGISNAQNVVPASTKESTNRPSMTTSKELAWTKISCTLCGMQLHLDSNRRIISSTNFLKECRGAGTKGSTPIHTFFKPTPPTPAAGVQAATQPEFATPPSTTGPRPKRLHFSTPLTAREDTEELVQAMTPSQNTGSQHSRKTAALPKTEPPQGHAVDAAENPERRKPHGR